ncbi:MAG: alpha/beta hydrolase [Gammaproteobacteria bacterium]|nr:alpha/beta hydrolase [Gammaproteobacteria bacterium]
MLRKIFEGLRFTKIAGNLVIVSMLLVSLPSCGSGRAKPPIVQACSDNDIGSTCRFTSRKGNLIQGKCLKAKKNPNILICKPERNNQTYQTEKTGRPSNDKKMLSGSCDCEVERNISYKESGVLDSKYSKLDIFHRGVSDKKPVLVFVHGGGWVTGDKSNVESTPNILNFFLDKGFVVVSVNFRLVEKSASSKVKYYDQLDDIASSIKWLSENVQDYGGSGDDYILVGYSSGAHLVSLLATDTSYLKNKGLSVDIIRAVAAWDVPAYDIPSAIKLMSGTPLEPKIRFNEVLFGESIDDQIKASPLYHVDNSKMPFFLASSGVKDGKNQTVTKQVSELFKAALIRSGHTAEHVHYENSEHSALVLQFGTKGNDLLEKMESFLKNLPR